MNCPFLASQAWASWLATEGARILCAVMALAVRAQMLYALNASLALWWLFDGF